MAQSRMDWEEDGKGRILVKTASLAMLCCRMSAVPLAESHGAIACHETTDCLAW